MPYTGTAMSLLVSLTINGVTPEDLGKYSCEAKNAAGMHKRATVELILGMTKYIYIVIVIIDNHGEALTYTCTCIDVCTHLIMLQNHITVLHTGSLP